MTTGTDHEYEHHTHGQDNQVLEVILGPGQSVHTENGAMCFMEKGIRMHTGTGRKRGPWSILKRKISGESVLLSIFTNNGEEPAPLGLNPAHPAHIKAVRLDASRPDIICQQGSFLAGHPDVRVTIAVASIKTTVFGRGNLVMQRLHGLGQAFLTGNGVIIEKELEPGETFLTEPKAIAAFEDSVDYGAEMFGGGSNILWSKENMFALKLTGPGRVWFQSASQTPRHTYTRPKDRARAAGG